MQPRNWDDFNITYQTLLICFICSIILFICMFCWVSLCIWDTEALQICQLLMAAALPWHLYLSTIQPTPTPFCFLYHNNWLYLIPFLDIYYTSFVYIQNIFRRECIYEHCTHTWVNQTSYMECNIVVGWAYAHSLISLILIKLFLRLN